jgi:hypothetical protein
MALRTSKGNVEELKTQTRIEGEIEGVADRESN